MNKIWLGTCANEQLIIDLFGSVSEFARLIEVNGNNFTFGNIKVEYDEDDDMHDFWKIEN